MQNLSCACLASELGRGWCQIVPVGLSSVLYSTLEAINFAIVRGCIALDTCFYGSQDFFLADGLSS